jgi:ABC-type oligopeptide transport system substrate-binding subunit
MEKKLPKVFANKIDKELKNNEKVYYEKKESTKPDEETRISEVDIDMQLPDLKNKTVRQKINAIFNSPTYVYKAEVDIKLKSGTITKKIIGKNTKNLITIDDELIPIIDIEDINFSK